MNIWINHHEKFSVIVFFIWIFLWSTFIFVDFIHRKHLTGRVVTSDWIPLQISDSVADQFEYCPLSTETSVVKLHHKFMLASYMMQIAKFLAILHHNASFYNFCIIINSFHCLIFSKYWRVIVVSVSHHSAAGCGWWARLAGAF